MLHNVELLILFLLIAVFLAGAVLALSSSLFRGANPALPAHELSVGSTILNVEVARTASERMQGLSGRASLSADGGMYFIFNAPQRYGFWMKDMQFPIDMIWIRNGAVAGFSENAAPEPGVALWNLKTYYPPDTADAVLEVNAGFVAAHGIRVGDAVLLRG